MEGDRLEIVDGVTSGGWIKSELTGEGGSVTAAVPDRYDAYIRILHPARDSGGDLVKWAQVAGELGRTVHPLAQWDPIVGANRYRNETPDWPGSEPATGSLDQSLLGPLCDLLDGGTTTPERCFFGIWNGLSWGPLVALPPDSPESGRKDAPWRSTDDLSFAFTAAQTHRPRLDLPGREYVVLAGPLVATAEIAGSLSPSSPNLIWPEDRAWLLASEIDFDSTLVGGSPDLIEAILADERFEAWKVGPRDLLTWDADKLNPPLPR